MTVDARRGAPNYLKLCKGKAYLVPTVYASNATDKHLMGEYMPALFHSATGSEDNLQIFVETSALFNGLPIYHLVPLDEVRRMPPTFKNEVQTPVTRRLWEENSAELMQVMDGILQMTNGTPCKHQQCQCEE